MVSFPRNLRGGLKKGLNTDLQEPCGFHMSHHACMPKRDFDLTSSDKIGPNHVLDAFNFYTRALNTGSR